MAMDVNTCGCDATWVHLTKGVVLRPLDVRISPEPAIYVQIHIVPEQCPATLMFGNVFTVLFIPLVVDAFALQCVRMLNTNTVGSQ